MSQGACARAPFSGSPTGGFLPTLGFLIHALLCTWSVMLLCGCRSLLCLGVGPGRTHKDINVGGGVAKASRRGTCLLQLSVGTSRLDQSSIRPCRAQVPRMGGPAVPSCIVSMLRLSVVALHARSLDRLFRPCRAQSPRTGGPAEPCLQRASVTCSSTQAVLRPMP